MMPLLRAALAAALIAAPGLVLAQNAAPAASGNPSLAGPGSSGSGASSAGSAGRTDSGTTGSAATGSGNDNSAGPAPTGSPASAAPPPPTGQAASPGQTASTGPAEGETERAEVEGFRSARWGMTDAEVRAAIRKDFNIPPEKVQTESNPTERTTVLSVTVNDLLEGAGPARVSYILGFSTKKLIQVNILWGTAVDPRAKPDQIVVAANQLRDLFDRSGYDPETVVNNAKGADGSLLVFQGQDAQKRTTVLRLLTGPAPPPARGERERPAAVVSLQLSYSLDARNPDVYRLRRGQF